MKTRALLLLSTFLTGFAQGESTPPRFSAYGFLLPTYLGASAGVESFSQPNLSAYTAAANPALNPAEDASQSSFQVAQSRIGFLLQTSEHTKARIELDFIDFSKASPTVAALPRLRRANIEHESGDFTFRLGQDWDVFSPLAPHTFNLVGHYFESGDLGFMRLQAQAIWKQGAWEHALSLGLPGNNNSPTEQTLELGLVPTLALRETFRPSAGASVGASLIGTSLRRDRATVDRTFAGAINLFGEYKQEDFEVRSEAYLGRNTFNLGLLGLGFANAQVAQVDEAGAFVTARVRLTESIHAFGGGGGAWVLSPSAMLPSYTTTTSGSALAGTGPGLERNLTLRLGGEWRLEPTWLFFVESAWLVTRHHLTAADAARLNPDRSAVVLSVGSQLSF